MRTCIYCGTEFESNHPTRISCKSSICENAAKQASYLRNREHILGDRRIVRSCTHCGRNLVGTQWRRYCPARECREAMKKEIYEGRKKHTPAEKAKREAPKYRCQRCGGWIRNGNRMHCNTCLTILSGAYSPDAEGYGAWYL